MELTETADHVVQLQALERDVAQGYYFAKPLSVADAEAFIRKHCGSVKTFAAILSKQRPARAATAYHSRNPSTWPG